MRMVRNKINVGFWGVLAIGWLLGGCSMLMPGETLPPVEATPAIPVKVEPSRRPPKLGLALGAVVIRIFARYMSPGVMPRMFQPTLDSMGLSGSRLTPSGFRRR